MYLRLAIAAVIAVLLAGGGWKCYVMGRQSVQAEWDIEKARMAEAAAKTQEAHQANADTVAEKVAKASTKDRIVYRTILKEAANVPNDCSLPADVRMLHDAAAAAEMPDTSASGVDAAAVTAKALTETLVENYEVCNDAIRKLEGIQEIVRAYNSK